MLHINHKKVTVKLFEVCIINTNWLRSNNVWSLLTIDFTKSNLSWRMLVNKKIFSNTTSHKQ